MQIDRELIKTAYDNNLICAPQLEVGKFILVDVVSEGYIIPSLASVIDNKDHATKAANAHNNYKGIKPDKAAKLIGQSMTNCLSKPTKK